MDWQYFLNDPDVCWPIVRRRIGEELLDLFVAYLEVAATRGRSLTWNRSFPDPTNYRAAVYRLRKQGLVVCRQQGSRRPVIAVADGIGAKQSPSHRPHRWWRRKWNGLWYLLVYDVPESDRHYRDELRRFLVRKRMGCFQKSVWITPHDIRPEYADLSEAAGLERYAFLFQSRTVLGRDPVQVVEASWDADKLRSGHAWYLDACERTLEKIDRGDPDSGVLQRMAREEMAAYLTVMDPDPLLPEALHPPAYLGPQVADMHTQFIRTVARRL